MDFLSKFYGNFCTGAGVRLKKPDDILSKFSDKKIINEYKKLISKDLKKTKIDLTKVENPKIMDIGTGRQSLALSENIKKINGAIEVKKNSHKIGLIRGKKKQVKKINLNKRYKSVTFEPDLNILAKFKTEVMEVKIGDMIAMDLRLFHRSGKNRSKIIRLSCINRVFDTAKMTKDIR